MRWDRWVKRHTQFHRSVLIDCSTLQFRRLSISPFIVHLNYPIRIYKIHRWVRVESVSAPLIHHRQKDVSRVHFYLFHFIQPFHQRIPNVYFYALSANAGCAYRCMRLKVPAFQSNNPFSFSLLFHQTENFICACCVLHSVYGTTANSHNIFHSPMTSYGSTDHFKYPHYYSVLKYYYEDYVTHQVNKCYSMNNWTFS